MSRHKSGRPRITRIHAKKIKAMSSGEREAESEQVNVVSPLKFMSIRLIRGRFTG
jgi:hypothetical protein